MSASSVMQGLPVASARQAGREVWAMSRGHRAKLLAVALVGIAGASAGLVPPATIGYVVDRVRDGSADTTTLLVALAIMVTAAFLGAIGAALTVVLAARSYHSMLAELRERLVERSLSLPQSLVEKAGMGDLVSRSSDDVSEIADAAPAIIPAFTTVTFTILVTFGGMAALDIRYAIILLLMLPVYFTTVRWYLKTGPRVYRAERAAMSHRAQQLVESQRGYASILGLNLTEMRHKRVLDASWAVVAHSLRARTVQNMFFGRLNFAEFLGMAGILVIGFWLVDNELSTVGGVTAAMLLFLRLFGPINHLMIVIDTLQSVLASLGRMIGVIQLPAADAETSSIVPDSEFAALIDQISHRYSPEGPYVISNVSLQVRWRQRIAVVGASGAGKTTLAAILAGIHKPEEGTAMRPRRTAVITQESHVFNGSLRENLTLASPNATDEDVFGALEKTGAHGLLKLFDEGLDAEIGAAGRELTAAQAQQLALARVLLADPDLAILDEATAEAGSTHAGLLDRAAEAVLADRSGIVIAHRLSQAASCDFIIVMDRGRIIESGTHDELVLSAGTYAELWSAWRQWQGG